MVFFENVGWLVEVRMLVDGGRLGEKFKRLMGNMCVVILLEGSYVYLLYIEVVCV